MHCFRGRVRTSAGGGTPGKFQYLVWYFVWLAWRRGVHHYKSGSIFFSFQNIFFIETSWRLVVNRKKLRLDLRYDLELKKIQNLFWRYAELNCF